MLNDSERRDEIEELDHFSGWFKQIGANYLSRNAGSGEDFARPRATYFAVVQAPHFETELPRKIRHPH